MATLTHAMLADLHSGCAAISFLAYSSGFTYASADFTDADQLFTLKDSFQITSDDPSFENIQVDQYDEIIDQVLTKGGNWMLQGNVPSIATAIFDYFYTSGVTIASGSEIKGQEGDSYTGSSYYMTPNEVEVSLLVESESRQTAICFARVKLVLNNLQHDDDTNPSYSHFTGAVLPNGTSGQGDFAILKSA